MKPKLGIIDKYRPMWEGGKSVEKYNVKVGFKIRMFVVSQITSQRQKNPNLLTQKDIEQLTKMIMELKQDKTTIPPEQQTCTLEEYQQFLSEFFSKVDYEDRHETVTMKTTSKFRLMASFIDVLSSWGPIDDEMIKCKKYCQYKAVDIFKALKKGEIPKRGGPKEQLDENNNENNNNIVNQNEINNNNDANLINHNNIKNSNINQLNNKNNQNIKINNNKNNNNNQTYINHNFKSVNPNQKNNINQNIHNNQAINHNNNITNKNNNINNKNNNINYNKINNNTNFKTKSNNINQIPQHRQNDPRALRKINNDNNQKNEYLNKTENKEHKQTFYNNNHNMINKDNFQQYQKNNQTTAQNNINFQKIQPNQADKLRSNYYKNKNTKLRENYNTEVKQNNNYNLTYNNDNIQINNKALNSNYKRKSLVCPSKDGNQKKRTFNGKYRLTTYVPVKYNSVPYFMLVENVRINNENALKAIKRNKTQDVLNLLLDSLDFLSYIHK